MSGFQEEMIQVGVSEVGGGAGAAGLCILLLILTAV